ncbi:MAG: excinuclease ABC subunit UvrA, partial [Spirochaetales bacterium]|nr:excinuclease ABC subunit UvrA [Spirochaetales bacterium]
MADYIKVLSASTHNLKNISVDIPKHAVVVFSGVSGSGKSSLVFDTIYTEAQRQLIDTFSSFARRWLPKLSRPPVEEIRNLTTSIVIDQKRLGANSRSTVGTATEIAIYLRLLYSRCGTPSIGPSFYFSYNHPEGMCPSCKGLGKRVRADADLLLDRSKSIREGAICHPEYKVGGWNWRDLTAIDLFDRDTPIAEWKQDEIDKLLYTETIPISRPDGAAVYAKNFEGIARRLERLYTQKGDVDSTDQKKDAYRRFFINTECSDCNGTRISRRARSVLL